MELMMKPLPGNQFLYGVSCVPYALSKDWPMAEWDHDFATIKSLNFNTMRIFAAWERIETAAGCYDFAKTDYAMALAAKHGLNVIIQMGGMFRNFCGFAVPQWWQQPCCPDFAPYRQTVDAFMAETVRRYAAFPQLLGWMIWNEPEADVCKCEDTVKAFQTYLRQKYGTLSQLCEAWSTMQTLRYADWSEVRPGVNSKLAAADYILFRQARMSDSLRAIHDLVKANDPFDHFTTANVVNHFAALNGPFSAADFGVDLGSAARCMDVMGYSFYHVEHSYDVEDDAAMRHAYKQSRFRSVSQAPDRRVFVLETGAGPNMRQLTTGERTRLAWQMIGHNAKGILLWNFRSRLADGQVGLFNLMQWDGSVSRRAESAAAFSATLQKHAALLNQVFPKHQAAVLTPELNQIMMTQLCAPEHVPENYEGEHLSRFGAYKMLWDNKVGADCLTEYQYNDFGNYRLLLLPMLEHMTLDLAQKLKAFVANGGTLIAESPFAFRDGQGLLQYHAPAFGLEEVFGAWTNDRENRETATGMMYPGGTAEVCKFWSEYTLTAGTASVLYEDGGNAVAVNHYGKGCAIVAGTEIFRQYMRNPQAAATQYFKEIILNAVAPDAVFAGNASNVEVLRLAGAPGVVTLLINHNNQPRTFTAALRDGNHDWQNLLTGDAVDPARPVYLASEETLVLFQAAK